MSVGKVLLLLPVLVLAALFAGPMDVPSVHAASGLVCLADPSTASSATPCPASAPVFDGPSGQQIRVGVFVSVSDGLDAFDVILLADHAVLRPAGADLTGTVLIGTPVVLAECLSGVLVAGSSCASTDSVDTVHFSATSALGSPNTTAPTNGLLFTAIYNITSVTAVGSPISVGFQSGCSQTSVSPNICVTIANGTPTANVETVQGASFSNSDSATMAAVDVTATPTSFGPEFPGTSNTATVTATAVNGYPGLATDSVSFTTKTSPGLTATISGVNPCSTGGVSCSVTLTLSASAFGNYSVTVYGTYSTTDPSGNPDTLVGTVSLVVVVYDFGFSVSSTSVSFNSANTGSDTITLTSLNGFAGSVTLSSGTILPPGLTITYNPNPVVLTAGGTLTSVATFTAHPTSSTTYNAKIKATVGTRVKQSNTINVRVTVGQDFTITANPLSVQTAQGVAGTSTITVTGVAGFTGLVSLGVSASAGTLSCSLNPTSVTGSGTSNLSCTGSAPGSFSANVTGISGTLGHSVIVGFTIFVPKSNFTIAASPTSVTVLAGVTASSIVTVTSVFGFTGSLAMTEAVGGGSGLACSLSRSSLELVSDGSNTTTLSCAGSQGLYTVTVSASNVTFTYSTTVTVTVQDFTLTAAPITVSVNATISGTSTITVGSQQGFSGTVNLSSSITPGTGLTCSLTLNTVSGSGTSSLSCSGSTGSYSINVTGTSGPISHFVLVAFTVEDFSISASPGTIHFAPGSSGVSTVTISPLHGFSGTVTLTSTVSDSSLTASFSSASVPGGSGTSTLTLSGPNAGSFTVTVTGTSGPLTHSFIVNVNIAAGPDFSVSASPVTVNTTSGVNGDSTIIVKPLVGFTGTIMLSSSVAGGTGLSCSLTPTSILLGASGNSTLSCSGSLGSYTVSVSGTNGTVTHSVDVTVLVQDFTLIAAPTTVTVNSGVAGTSTITVGPVSGFAGTVALSFTTNSTNLSCTLTSSSITGGSGTSTLSCSASVVGNYLASVTATSGVLSHSVSVTFIVQDFTVAAGPASLAVNIGASGVSTITVSPLNGFTGTVTLGATTNSTNLSCTLISTTIAGGSGTSTLSCSGSVGDYLATVAGTSAGVSHSVSVTIRVQDFNVVAGPTSVTVNAGVPAGSTITVGPANGFAGTVSLIVVTNSTSMLCSLTPTSVPGGSGTSALSCTSSVGGNYLVTVTGTNAGLSHAGTVSVHVGDFLFTGSVSTLTVAEGLSGSFNVLLVSSNGFAGTVNLSASVLGVPFYTGPLPTASVTSTVSLSAGGSQTAVVTVTVATNIQSNIFEVNVTASSGVLVERVLVSLTVPVPGIMITASPGSIVVGPSGTGATTVSVTSLGGVNGLVTFSALGYSKTGLLCSLGLTGLKLATGGSNTTSLSCSGSVGSYNVTISATGTAPSGTAVSASGYAGVVVADFSLSSAASAILVNTGQSGYDVITVSWTGHFSGVVNLTLVPSSGLSATITSRTVHGSGSSNVTVSSNVAGVYSLVVNGTSGPSSHSITITVTVSSTTPSNTSNIFGLDPTLFYSLVGVLVVAVLGGVVFLSRRGKPAKKGNGSGKKR
jgi:hypothetical protein